MTEPKECWVEPGWYGTVVFVEDPNIEGMPDLTYRLAYVDDDADDPDMCIVYLTKGGIMDCREKGHAVLLRDVMRPATEAEAWTLQWSDSI